MSGPAPSSPQLEVVKNMLDTATSQLKVGNAVSVVSKNFRYEAFHGATEMASLDAGGWAEWAQGMLDGTTKVDLIYHEIIEAPGKVVIHVTGLFDIAGATFPYDTLVIASLEEEDGVLKLSSIKDFADPQKRSAAMAAAAKAAAERRSTS